MVCTSRTVELRILGHDEEEVNYREVACDEIQRDEPSLDVTSQTVRWGRAWSTHRLR